MGGSQRTTSLALSRNLEDTPESEKPVDLPFGCGAFEGRRPVRRGGGDPETRWPVFPWE